MAITPTDWGALTKDYNQRLKDLKYRLENELIEAGGGWAGGYYEYGGPSGGVVESWTDSETGQGYGRDENGGTYATSPGGWDTDPELQAQYDALLAERDVLPAKIAAENKLIAEEKAKAEYDAKVLAEDIAIQEKAQSKNAMANDTLARMNQRQAADDAQKTASRKGVIDSGGRGVGPAYDIKKQREAGQQKVGAAMSAAPGVSAFAGKANAVSPINATSQTANTGVMQGLNKSFDLGQLVADRANRDEAAASQFSGERSKAQNVGQANSFTPPNMQGIQIGETPIGKFGGS